MAKVTKVKASKRSKAHKRRIKSTVLRQGFSAEAHQFGETFNLKDSKSVGAQKILAKADR